MKALMVVCMLAAGTSVYGQAVQPPEEAPHECWPTAHIDQVVVQLTDGTKARGTLLCFGQTDFTLLQQGAVTRFALHDVARVRKAPDGVLDGAAKGAAVSLIMAVLCGSDCTGETYLRVTVAYALFGLAIDAADTHMDTIYRSPTGKRVAVGFRVPF